MYLHGEPGRGDLKVREDEQGPQKAGRVPGVGSDALVLLSDVVVSR